LNVKINYWVTETLEVAHPRKELYFYIDPENLQMESVINSIMTTESERARLLFGRLKRVLGRFKIPANRSGIEQKIMSFWYNQFAWNRITQYQAVNSLKGSLTDNIFFWKSKAHNFREMKKKWVLAFFFYYMLVCFLANVPTREMLIACLRIRKILGGFH